MIIRVENFQSLASVELQLAGLTALVGPSDRGKSALVRAIQGALFNLPGEFFVRTGATSVRVVVEWGTADGAQHVVVWEKGGGKNQFQIDGELHSKVGTKAPEVLRALGFRDELIGARLTETGPEGGKWVRPQIAEQFDEIYLLKEPGTFINEVIVKLSRLGVLQKASRACSSDLRHARSLLKVRQGDLAVATVAAEKLAEAPLLRARLDGLLTMDAELDALRTRIGDLRTLIAARATAKARLQTPLPEIDPDRTATAQQALQDYRELLQAREAVGRRVFLATLPKALPPTRTAVTGPEFTALVAKVQRWKALADAVGTRTMREVALGRMLAAMRAATARCQEAEAKVARFRAETPVCPLCSQPWTESHTEVPHDDRSRPEPYGRHAHV